MMQPEHVLLGAQSLTTACSSIGGGVNIDFDLSFIVQFFAFLLLFLIVKPLLLDPFLAVMTEREKRTEGAKAESREIDAKVAPMRANYEAQLDGVRKQAGQDRDRARADAQKLEAGMLEQARKKAEEIMADGRIQVAKQTGVVRAQLATQTQALGGEVASMLLGRKVQ